MDNEEKKVKTTAPKKKTTTKKTTKSSISKPAKKATTTKKVTEKKVTEKKAEAKPVKKVTKKQEVKKQEPKKEIPAVKKEEVLEKKETVVITEKAKKGPSEEILEIRKRRHIIEAVIIVVLLLIAIMLLSNRTFLKTSYKNDNIDITIPRFSYFVKDKDNKVKLVTLRKSKYLKEYYNEYLEGFIFYSCAEGEKTFYYNENTRSLIKEIKVEKKFAIKTVEITYDTRSPEEVCGIK